MYQRKSSICEDKGADQYKSIQLDSERNSVSNRPVQGDAKTSSVPLQVQISERKSCGNFLVQKPLDTGRKGPGSLKGKATVKVPDRNISGSGKRKGSGVHEQREMNRNLFRVPLDLLDSDMTVLTEETKAMLKIKDAGKHGGEISSSLRGMGMGGLYLSTPFVIFFISS